MSHTRLQTCLLAVLAWMAITPLAKGQYNQPFIDPNEFNPDYQFFAPVDLESFGGGQPGNTGWYGAYDRVYIWVSRPEGVANQFVARPDVPPLAGSNNGAAPPSQIFSEDPTGMDATWGNRFDIGYMTEENHGWLVSFLHVDGPNQENVNIVERNGRFVDGSPQTDPIDPQRDNNNRITGDRSYLVTQSINTADLSNIEINKTWRLKPLHNGSVLEPFIGVKYSKFIDYYRSDTYNRFDDMGLVPNLPILTDAIGERYTANRASFINHIIGGQVGARWYTQRTRWNLSSEVRFFAGQNFQDFSAQTDVETSIVDEGAGSVPDLVLFERTNSAAHRSEFVWGGEVRAEAAFQMTRDIALRMGANVIGYAQGIGRGNNPNVNSEDLTLVGLTFGVTVNR